MSLGIISHRISKDVNVCLKAKGLGMCQDDGIFILKIGGIYI